MKLFGFKSIHTSAASQMTSVMEKPVKHRGENPVSNTAAPEVLQSSIADLLEKHESELLNQWVTEQLASTTMRRDLMKETELREQSRQFLSLLRSASQAGNLSDLSRIEWAGVRDLLTDISKSRASQGFSPSETSGFIFSFRGPLIDLIQREGGVQPGAEVGTNVRVVTGLIDKLGLFTFEEFQKSRESIIYRQQQEMLELSTPVVRLFEGVVAVPLIGTLDSARTQVVMENLLQRIVETGAELAIIDITGVPTVDTLVAQHLLKAVAAARLMGADCIISGIRPQIAQTIVHLGVDLQNVTTKATMADAFMLALQRLGMTVTRGHKKISETQTGSGEK
jgi:rsbT co-antagonist protein RsbR